MMQNKKELPKEVRNILDTIWSGNDYQHEDPVNTLNSVFILGIASSEYSKLDSDSLLAKALTKEAERRLDKANEKKKLVNEWYESNKKKMPKVWEMWFKNKFSLVARGIHIKNSAKHLQELWDFHENEELQKDLRLFGR